jgi:ketosteroid isomerase-like protein
MTRAPAPAQIDLIGELFTAVDSGDTGTAAALFTDDIRFAFGNNPPVYGRNDVEGTMRGFLASIAGIRHELTGLWQVVGNQEIVVAEMTVHYSRLDGTAVSLPCCNVFRTRDGAIADYRIFMDVNPVFAAGRDDS